MNNIRIIKLYDDIRNDALILMKENPSLKYQDAFKQAKESLIGNINIKDFEFKPFTIELDSSLNKNSSEELIDEEDYFTYLKKQLKDYINVDEFTEEQLKAYNIAVQMNVDITKFADKNFSPKQIEALCLLSASGRNIDKYIHNYDFEPTKVIEDAIMIDSKK